MRRAAAHEAAASATATAGSEVRRWFSRLSVSERVRAVSTTDDARTVAAATSACRRLTAAAAAANSAAFSASSLAFAESPAAFLLNWDADSPEDFCTQTMVSLQPLCLARAGGRARALAEAALVAAVRVGWANGAAGDGGYAAPDTLTLFPRFLEDSAAVFRALRLVTFAGFLQTPCRVDCRLENGKVVWKWEDPGWWKENGHHTVGELVAVLVEKALWARWFEATGRDPRVPGCTRRYSPAPQHAPPATLTENARRGTAEMWLRMKPQERRAALTSLPQALQTQLPRKTWEQHKEALSTLVAMLPERSVEAECSNEGLEDVLFTSTLAAFGTSADRIIKLAAACLSNVYVERLLRDLGAPSATASGSKRKRRGGGGSSTQRAGGSARRDSKKLQQQESSEASADLSAPTTSLKESEPAPAPAPSPTRVPAEASQSRKAAAREMRFFLNLVILPRMWNEIEKRRHQKQQPEKGRGTTEKGDSKGKKRRRAGPSATALDLAADLVSTNPRSSQKATAFTSPELAPSASLDLASAAARHLPPSPSPSPSLSQKQQQQQQHTTSAGRGGASTADALDLAREKQRRGNRRTPTTTPGQPRSKTRSHSNPRKALASSASSLSGSRLSSSASSSSSHLDLAESLRVMRPTPPSTPLRARPRSCQTTPLNVQPLPVPAHPPAPRPQPPSLPASPLHRPQEISGSAIGRSPTAPPSPHITAKPPTYLEMLISRPSLALDLATAEDQRRGRKPQQQQHLRLWTTTAALDLANPSSEHDGERSASESSQSIPIAVEPTPSLAHSAPVSGIKPTYLSRLLNQTGPDATYFVEGSQQSPRPVLIPSSAAVSQPPPPPQQQHLHQRSSSNTSETPSAASDTRIVPEMRRNKSSPMLVPPPLQPHQPQLPPSPTPVIPCSAAIPIHPPSLDTAAIALLAPAGSPGCLSAKSDDSDIFDRGPVSGLPFLDLAAPPSREQAHSASGSAGASGTGVDSGRVGSSGIGRSGGGGGGGSSVHGIARFPPPLWYKHRTQTWFMGDQGFTPVSLECTPPISPSSSPADHTSPETTAATTSPTGPIPVSPRLPLLVPSPSRSPRIKREKSPIRHNQDALDLADAISPTSSPRSYGALDRMSFQSGAVFYEPFSAAFPPPSLASAAALAAPVLPPWADVQYSERELSREIRDFALYVTQMLDDSRHLYESMLAKVVAVTQRVLPKATVRAFGSFACNLCIPSSDLDLVCSIQDKMENLRKAFRTLARELRKEDWVSQIKPIETATVPIIKLWSRDEGIPTDITFDCAQSETGVPQHRGLRSVELVRRYLSETPKLRPLLLVVKQFLYERGLNNTYTGGLNSHALVLMLKTFLHISEAAGNVLDEGDALVAFFRYYGTEFDYSTTGISVRHGGVHFRIGEVGHYSGTGPLVIEDPFDPMTNIAGGVFAMWRVRAAFESAYVALTSSQDPSAAEPPKAEAASSSSAIAASPAASSVAAPQRPAAPTLLSRILSLDQ